MSRQGGTYLFRKICQNPLYVNRIKKLLTKTLKLFIVSLSPKKIKAIRGF